MFHGKRLLMDKVSLILIIALLFFRYPLLYMGQFGLINNMISTMVFLSGTYLFTGIFICKNLKNLNQYSITTPALIIFLLSPVLSCICNPSDFTAFIRIAMAIIFAVFLYCKRKTLNTVKNSVKKIIPDSLLVVACIMITTILFAYIRGFSGVESSFTLSMLINSLMYQLSYAATMEEPLFRGFLWGSFRQLGLKEIWICVLQALLFWIGHIYYFNTGMNFWIIIPIGSLVLGLVVMKTKSITYSMVTHSFMNAFGDIFQHYIKLL